VDSLYSHFLDHPSVCTDSRKVKSGDLFFALRGPSFNGNAFAAGALEQGASLAVIDDPAYQVAGDARYFLVDDALKSLQQLAIRYRQQLNMPVLGLTGSNGKTTTKELIASVLRTQKRVFATAGNYNNHIGVPLSLLAIPRDAEIAIIEMGTNQPGDIAELTSFTQPSHGLITNVGKAHLERLGSLEGVRVEKGALYDYIREQNAFAFVNVADHRVARAAEGISRTLTYGTSQADLWSELISESLEGMKLRIHHAGEEASWDLDTRISGAYNEQNVLTAVAVGLHFGFSKDNIRSGIFAYQPANNRSQLSQIGPYQVWLDAYNANPNSMQAAVAHVCRLAPGKACLILGDMFELGEKEAAEHAALGDFINDQPFGRVIGIGRAMRAMVEQVEGAKNWFEKVEDAQAELPGLLEGHSLILVKGSRGMALERILPWLEGEGG
jgi:UDP-N-acetylmuramoyl-tripeptide--D-alanyl-D-alanine ligase